MSEDRKRPKVKLDARVPPELKQAVIDFQQRNNMKEISEATIALIEKGLFSEVETVNIPRCKAKSYIPSQFGKFNKCTRDRITVTAEECLKCETRQAKEMPEIQRLTRENSHLHDLYWAQDRMIKNLKEENASLKKYAPELNERPKAVIPQPLITTDLHGLVHQEPISAAATETRQPQIVKRVIKETIGARTKETTEFVTPPPAPELKKPSEQILCHKLSSPSNVSVDDACRKCDTLADCPNYGEYYMLKRAIKTQ